MALSGCERVAPAAGIVICLALCAASLGACDPLDRTEGPAPSASQRSPEPRTFKYPFLDPSKDFEARAKDLVSRLTPEERLAELSYEAPAVERLGVPAYNWWNEALHGVARNGKATVFPQAIALAATFDTRLVTRVAIAISDEARAKFRAAEQIGNRGRYSGLTFWSPTINIFRDPRWGRGQETYGEDPYLTSRMGVAFVRGLQGDDPKYLKTAACAKHFAVHSGPEGLRHEFDAKPSKKDLVETYLPAFEALVKEAKVEGVMAAYNRVYGEPAAGSTYLLQDILRKGWGFRGYVVSDCWALVDFHTEHKVTKTPAESAAKALLAGTNLNCGSTFPYLAESLEQGLVEQRQVDQALETLLETRFKLGLFDPPGSGPFDSISPKVIASPKHSLLAREAAVASIVMLKNDRQTLPLGRHLKRIAVQGPYATDGYVLLGNYFGGATELVTLYEGINAAVDAGTAVDYQHAFLAARPNLNPVDWTTSAAKDSQVVIVTLGLSGRIEGEEGAANESDFKGDRKDIALPRHQVEYLEKLRAAGDAKIVVVLFSGSAVAIPRVHELADAVLLAWYPGQEGGHAIADVLFGRESPSGRLPITVPRSVDDLPDFDDYDMSDRTYRYAEKEPLYPFGFGLTYTKVSYDKLELAQKRVKAGQSLDLTVNVKNSGERPVDEVVQVYLRDDEASVRTPKSSLVAFRRVTLGPGVSKAVRFTIPGRAMRLVTEAGERIYEPGKFTVFVGGASPTPRAEALGSPPPVQQSFELTE